MAIQSAKQEARDYFRLAREYMGEAKIQAGINARDAAIRAEEREACAQVAFKYKAVQGLARVSIGEAIRARAQPGPAPEHGDLSSRSGAKAEGGAERAKETGARDGPSCVHITWIIDGDGRRTCNGCGVSWQQAFGVPQP